jgi:hypothetical protein
MKGDYTKYHPHPTFITTEIKQQPKAKKYPLTFGYQNTSAQKEPSSDGGMKTQPQTKVQKQLCNWNVERLNKTQKQPTTF